MKFCGRIRGLTQSMHGTLDIRPDQVMLLFLVMELSTHCDSLYSGIQTGSSNLSSLPRTRRNAGVICNGLAIHMKGGGGRLVIFFINNNCLKCRLDTKFLSSMTLTVFDEFSDVWVCRFVPH